MRNERRGIEETRAVDDPENEKGEKTLGGFNRKATLLTNN